MASAKIQSFCEKYNLHFGVYKVKQRTILPKPVTEKTFSYIFRTTVFVFFNHLSETTLNELEENFKYEDNHVSDAILKRVEEYKVPISNDKTCMYAVFAFDLETCNVEGQLYCEPYAAGIYRFNRL